MITEILASIAVIVLILQHAARIPAALTELLNACQPLVHAAYALAATLDTADADPRDPIPPTPDQHQAPTGPPDASSS
ncbi:hypothetical protein OG225_06885 [Nocardia sp. NBC_01377]|uniref:hypothetical protein n=1 Tax=Nocardia sp. NBC_01377 TaxID=2903595 RepID=UPI00324A6FE1